MESCPEALRNKILKSEKLQVILERLEKTQNMPNVWNLFNGIFMNEALPLVDSKNICQTLPHFEKEFATLPAQEKNKTTLKDICKLNLDVFKNDLLALLKITFEHSINSILSKMNSSSNLKIEDFKLEQKKSVEIKIHRETTPEKLTEAIMFTSEQSLLPPTQPAEIRPTKTAPLSPGEKHNQSCISYTSDRFGLREFTNVPKINSEFYDRLTKKITRKRDQNTSVNYYRELPPIRSDFHSIKGAATFGQSKRKVFVVREESPGPSNYLIKTEVSPRYKKQPAAIFGTAHRKSWIHELEQRELSLSPKRTPSKN